ncbi:MAG: SPFH/Band 7/PHB domain protein [Dehalococcoidia bacterium]|nr:SPFH/Band 7/PHB domain protein [Dehalococcoidia bacterium]MSQ17636.1 SPFH/Band 7/PHB domain protein [Dehalococcoidia bacterium]
MASGPIIVQQYQRMVVQRLGTFVENRRPGFHFLMPFVYNGTRVDIRERVTRVPTQSYITADNVVVGIDFVIYFRVVEEIVERAVLSVQNFEVAVVNLAVATLRSVIGATTLAAALAERERIRDSLQIRLDEVTGRWGVKISQVEINEIEPPAGVKQAMEREKSAAAIKTAEITESEGQRQAQINRAEGEKQSAILNAEGNRQAAILNAEGDRQATILRAEGFSTALERIYQIANTVDAKTMSLQYFETLKALGASPATKFIFPMEFTSMLAPFLGMGNTSQQPGEGGATPAPTRRRPRGSDPA